MNVDLSNPVTIVLAIVFGLGGQLWVAWFKRQMELDDDDPEQAQARIVRLNAAGAAVVYRISRTALLIYWVGLGAGLVGLSVVAIINTGNIALGLEYIALGSGLALIGLGLRPFNDTGQSHRWFLAVGTALIGIVIFLQSMIRGEDISNPFLRIFVGVSVLLLIINVFREATGRSRFKGTALEFIIGWMTLGGLTAISEGQWLVAAMAIVTLIFAFRVHKSWVDTTQDTSEKSS